MQIKWKKRKTNYNKQKVTRLNVGGKIGNWSNLQQRRRLPLLSLQSHLFEKCCTLHRFCDTTTPPPKKCWVMKDFPSPKLFRGWGQNWQRDASREPLTSNTGNHSGEPRRKRWDRRRWRPSRAPHIFASHTHKMLDGTGEGLEFGGVNPERSSCVTDSILPF